MPRHVHNKFPDAVFRLALDAALEPVGAWRKRLLPANFKNALHQSSRTGMRTWCGRSRGSLADAGLVGGSIDCLWTYALRILQDLVMTQ
jgi:hypothetical protein